MKRLLILPLLLLLTACTTASTQTGLAASGQTLIGVGVQFVNVASVYTQHCKAVVPTDASAKQFCDGFRVFGPKFQQSYPLAVQTWKAATAANNTQAAQGAEATILGLAADLSTIALQAATAFGGK